MCPLLKRPLSSYTMQKGLLTTSTVLLIGEGLRRLAQTPPSAWPFGLPLAPAVGAQCCSALPQWGSAHRQPKGDGWFVFIVLGQSAVRSPPPPPHTLALVWDLSTVRPSVSLPASAVRNLFSSLVPRRVVRMLQCVALSCLALWPALSPALSRMRQTGTRMEQREQIGWEFASCTSA